MVLFFKKQLSDFSPVLCHTVDTGQYVDNAHSDYSINVMITVCKPHAGSKDFIFDVKRTK